MRKLLTRLSVAGALALGAVALAGPTTANASLALCTGSGKLTAQNPGAVGKAKWQVSGAGQCDTPRQVRHLSFTGAGTSTSLGLCTPGHLLVENLKLGVTVTTVGVVTGDVRKERQTWSSPVSVFPLVTPFFVSKGGLAGAGVTVHHIRLQCGNDGRMPSATFLWATLR